MTADPASVLRKLPADLDAPAKLTLSLRITGVRGDGYHEIEAEMVSLDFRDTIRLEAHSTRAESADVSVSIVGDSGLAVPADGTNLVVRALNFADVVAVATVNKMIPAGAGLGGGSSDAAAVLAWAGITDPRLAVELGADVGFCLEGRRSLVSGIGEVIVPLVHVERTFSLLTPPFGVSTPAVYRMWDELGGPFGDNGNDLESAALAVAPALERWRDGLWELRGTRPHLAGSGGTWFVEGVVVGAVDNVPTRVVQTIPGRTLS